MPTKTISVDLEAYRILRRERKGPRDSYSQVTGGYTRSAQPARWENSSSSTRPGGVWGQMTSGWPPRHCAAILAW